MKGITKLSSLLPVMFTTRNVAVDIYRRSDRHIAHAPICRLRNVSCHASENFYCLPLVLKYLSARVAYDMLFMICRLSLNGP